MRLQVFAGQDRVTPKSIHAIETVSFLALLLWTSCGPSFQPKQARFVVAGCEGSSAPLGAEAEWEVRPEPVLSPGPAGTWDSVDVLNPSVVKVGAAYYNLYSGFDGNTWHTGLATSVDGTSWDKQGTEAVISPDPTTWEGNYIAANGSLYHDGDHFLYWYQAGRRGKTSIGLADSAAAKQWSKHGRAVLAPGPSRSWDETGVGDPCVIRCRGTYTMYYLGQNRFGIQRLGVARSTDGIHWQKSHTNPILDTGPPGSFDERGLGEPAVFRAADRYLMLYTGRDANENRRIGWAESVNGVDWKKLTTRPVLGGSQAWNSHVVCDPSVWRGGGDLLVWFGGGSRPSPDENLKGRIGLAILRTKGSE